MYAVPIAVVAGLASLLVILLPRWRRRGPPGTAGADPVLASEDVVRLDAELARYDS